MKKDSSTTLFSNLSETKLHEITERIIYLRQNVLDLSQKQFADALNISQSYLSQVESKKKPLNESLVHKICASFQVDVQWLLFNQGDIDTKFLSSAIKSSAIESQNHALKELQTAFSLKSSDTDFLSWFLALNAEDRTALIRAIQNIQQLPSDE